VNSRVQGKTRSSLSDPLYSPQEAADILRYKLNYVYALMRNGKLRSILLGTRTRRVPKSAINDYLSGSSDVKV